MTGKRYIKKLVEDGVVDGWDDPRLVTISALRRRGFTPESIRMFVDLCGVAKANSSVDYAMLEYCIREDLKLKRSRVMAVLNPIKLIIDNYPEDQMMLSITLKTQSLEAEQFRLAESFTLRQMISWRSRQRSISVCSLAMRFV